MKCDYKRVFQLIDNGDWNGAHRLVQAYSDKLSCLIHGYLHRDEGDPDNASYWYQRGSEDLPRNRLEEELERLKQMAEQ